VQWLSAHGEIETKPKNAGHLLAHTTTADGVSQQLVSVAPDGLILFWDVRVKKEDKNGLIWTPVWRIQLSNPDGGDLSGLVLAQRTQPDVCSLSLSLSLSLSPTYHIHTNAHTNAWTHICTHARTHARTRARAHTHTQTDRSPTAVAGPKGGGTARTARTARVRAQSSRMQRLMPAVCVYVYKCVHKRAYIYFIIHTHTHAHTHTHTHVCV